MGFWQIYFYSFIILIVYAIVCIISIKYSNKPEFKTIEKKQKGANSVITIFVVLAILGPLGLAIFYLSTFFGILSDWCKS